MAVSKHKHMPTPVPLVWGSLRLTHHIFQDHVHENVCAHCSWDVYCHNSGNIK